MTKPKTLEELREVRSCPNCGNEGLSMSLLPGHTFCEVCGNNFLSHKAIYRKVKPVSSLLGGEK